MYVLEFGISGVDWVEPKFSYDTKGWVLMALREPHIERNPTIFCL